MTLKSLLILRSSFGMSSDFSSIREKYIGKASTTPTIIMGHMSLESFAKVNKVEASPGWVEADPIENDHGGWEAFSFDIERADLADLQARDANNQLGRVGDMLFALRNDSHHDWLSLGVAIEFELVKH